MTQYSKLMEKIRAEQGRTVGLATGSATRTVKVTKKAPAKKAVKVRKKSSSFLSTLLSLKKKRSSLIGALTPKPRKKK